MMVSKITETLRKEFRDRGRHPEGDFGNGVGLTYCICNCLGWVPIVSYITGLVGLVCFIIYWVKIAGISKELAVSSSYRGERDDRDDDRPRGYGGANYDDPRDGGGHDDKPWRNN